MHEPVVMNAGAIAGAGVVAGVARTAAGDEGCASVTGMAEEERLVAEGRVGSVRGAVGLPAGGRGALLPPLVGCDDSARTQHVRTTYLDARGVASSLMRAGGAGDAGLGADEDGRDGAARAVVGRDWLTACISAARSARG